MIITIFTRITTASKNALQIIGDLDFISCISYSIFLKKDIRKEEIIILINYWNKINAIYSIYIVNLGFSI